MPSTATSILDGLSTSVAVKAPCRTVATSNITLAGLQTISGYTTVENDRVLVVGQSTASQNGIYMASTGNWTRAKDADGARDLVQGTIVLVRSAGADGAIWELTTPNPIVIGTSALTFELRDDPAATYPQTGAEIAASVVPTNLAYPDGNVLRYGADPTGVADSTQAFRDACFSEYDAPSAPYAYRRVHVPAGTYRLTETVYVRAGSTIHGDGMATLVDAADFPLAGTDPVFRLGWGLISGVATKDTVVGDYPPEIFGMFCLGGPGNAAFVDLEFAGGLIHDLWFAAPGIGVSLQGGYLWDCEFDGGLNGLIIPGGLNQTIKNCRFFHQQYAIQVTGDCSNTIINGCTIEYPQVVGLSVTGNNVKALKVCNSDFFSNAQYDTLAAQALIGGTDCDIELENCRFSNMKNAAVYVASDTGFVAIKSAVFEGFKTNTNYTQSTTAAGVKVQEGHVSITNTEFRHLYGHALQVGGLGQPCTVIIDGANIISPQAVVYDVKIDSTIAAQDTIELRNIRGANRDLFDRNQYCLPRCRNLDDWLTIGNASSRDFVKVPVHNAALVLFTLQANVNLSGDGTYGKCRSVYVEKENDFAAGPTKTTYVNLIDAYAGTAHQNGLLDIDADVNSVGTGATATPLNNNMDVVISWPDSYEQVRINCQYITP